MTRDALAARPATGNQRGAVLCQFRRLGFAEDDRAQRLAASAALLGLDELGSVKDLAMGQAGMLVRILRSCRDREQLDALLLPPVPGPLPRPRLPLAVRIGRELAIAGVPLA